MTPRNLLQPALDAERTDRLILVTGATGFLGGYMVRRLLEKGVAVRAMGRNPGKGLELAAAGAHFVPVDLRDRTAVIEACRGVAAVVHAGALSSAWGKYQDFYDINVSGTENIIAGCRAHDVKRLVYISSPSVMSVHAPQENLDETHPLPADFVSMYSETKALAEGKVREAQSPELATVILRPKAIYGPGDTSVFPRILETVSKGRLPIVDGGQVRTNITHVTDVVQAIELALEKEAAVGKTYLVTGDEDIKIMDVVAVICERLGYPPPGRRLSSAKAMKLGKIMEDIFRRVPLLGEPPLTRYKVSIISFTQTYDISAIKKELGYRPQVSWRDGVNAFLDDLTAAKKKAPAPSPASPASEWNPVKMTLFKAGCVSTRERIFGLSSSWKKVDVPALFALIEHPKFGPIVYDTGYSTRLFQAVSGLPGKLYHALMSVHIAPEEDAGAQLKRHGVDPADVRWVIVSHFDPDHIGGLRDFPNAHFICSWRAWRQIAGKTGFQAMKERLMPALLPDDLAARTVLLPDPDGPSFPPLPQTFDLFGDNTIHLVELPGHQHGMLGVLLATPDGKRYFLCADAVWSRRVIASAGKRFGAHPFLAKDRGQQRETYRLLAEFAAAHPDIEIIPSHCPDAARQFVLS